MSKIKRTGRVWAIALPLCALAAAWAFGFIGKSTPVAQAQADNWTSEAAERQGVRLLETRDPSGPPAYPVQAGDLLFFTNVGTSYGGSNPRNAVVVVNAKTYKPIAVSDVEAAWSERWTSHGSAVSPDGKYVYLPAIAPANSTKPGAILVLDSRTLKIYQIIQTSGLRPHHVKIFTDWTGKQFVLVEDFNWVNPTRPPTALGGFYILDPADNNRVVTGMTPGHFRGNLYIGFTSPDGRYLYYSLPGAPEFRLSHEMEGLLVKIDMQTWRPVQHLAMGRYPLWTVFTEDGRWAWVTQSSDSKVMKIQRATAPGQVDRIVAEVATGPGPYGLRMSIDNTELWVADKGETLPGQRGTSITVIDHETNQVKRTMQTNCITNDHLILTPDGGEMWATCNQSHEIVVLDSKTYEIKTRIPMPIQGDVHGGSFVVYTQGPNGLISETVSDQNGLHGSARAAVRQALGLAANSELAANAQ